MKTALVLGGGGVVGLAYHAGVLRALEQEAGYQAETADVIVGTSAGSVMGAYLRSGWTTEDFWLLAQGTHPRMAAINRAEEEAAILAPAFRGGFDLMRRGLGSAFVIGRSMVRLPVPRLPGLLRHAFPGGLFAMTEGKRRFEEELPAEWPERPLWLSTYDIVSGRRIVLGSRGAPDLPLPRAVAASCAIPAVYPPVPFGRMTLVDGGVWSPTNLDLAARAECDFAICVAPLAFDGPRRSGLAQLAREVPARMLRREAATLRRGGVEVLLIRPSAAEVRAHGFNLMRPDGVDRVARAAYESTARLLETERFQIGLDHLRAA